ncbi:MAG: heme exporter protein CcmD [Candidatus Pacearchaeota archaeon]|nr:heme exporter protein CcmD [Candidatus Pacearchaeota archaeon]
MKMFSKKNVGTLFLLVIYFSLLNVSAINIGISPATINFEGVLRGGYAEETLIVSTDSNEDVRIKLESKGDIESWIDFSMENDKVSRDEFLYANVFVSPPADTPNGNYSGFLRVTTETLGEGIEDHAVGRVISSLDVVINVEVIDNEVISCSVSNLEIGSAEEGEEVLLRMSISNYGNVWVVPNVFVDVWDENQISIVKSEDFLGESVLPTTTQDFEFRISSDDLDVGQYWSDILIFECEQDSTLTFDILKEGSLSANGVLLDILTRREGFVKETIPIEVGFKNTGEKEVEAYFEGEISVGGKIVQVLESEKILVPMSEIEKFNFYFTPNSVGKYIISGRIFYSGKKTFESSTAIDIVSNGLNLNMMLWGVYGFFFVAIGLLFFKVRKERRIYLGKLRRLK